MMTRMEWMSWIRAWENYGRHDIVDFLSGVQFILGALVLSPRLVFDTACRA
jgi:hypothetical protein